MRGTEDKEEEIQKKELQTSKCSTFFIWSKIQSIAFSKLGVPTYNHMNERLTENEDNMRVRHVGVALGR